MSRDAGRCAEAYILLDILTATAGESTHPTGSIHVLDGHDLAHLAAACTAFAHRSGSSGGADDFQGRSVTEEAARLMLRAYRVAGLVFPKDAPSKLDNTPRRCAVPTPAGTITLPWPAALGSRRARAHPHDNEGTPAAAGTTTVSEAHVILIANERRVDTTLEGRRLLQTARDDVPPDGATAIVRRGSACMQVNKQVTLYCCILTQLNSNVNLPLLCAVCCRHRSNAVTSGTAVCSHTMDLDTNSCHIHDLDPALARQ